MTCAQPGAVIAVEVLVEQDVILPVGIFLEFFRASINGPPAIFIPQKNLCQPAANLFRDLKQRHKVPRAGRALHLEIIAIERVHQQQPADDQAVDRHPDGAPPVGVAAEHAGIRFGRQVLDFVLVPGQVKDEGMVAMVLRERAYAEGAKELVFVEHVAEDALQLLLVADGSQPAASVAIESAIGYGNLLDYLRMALAE